jgi:hypothetical protein
LIDEASLSQPIGFHAATIEAVSGVKLSTKGLENGAAIGIKDFKLRVSDQEALCSRFEAGFVSPRITSALSTDATIDQY